MELISLLRSESNNKWVNIVRVIGLIGLVIAIVFYFYLVLNFVFE